MPLKPKVKMKNRKISSIPKLVLERLEDYLLDLEEVAFNERAPLDWDWLRIEKSVNQEFLTQVDVSNILTSTDKTNIHQIAGETLDSQDLEGRLYFPLTAKQADWFEAHLRRIGIPLNKQFFRIQFQARTEFTKKYPHTAPVLEDSWMTFGKVAFDQIDAIPKLKQCIKQVVRLANTALFLDYDHDLSLVDIIPVNIKNFAIHPPTGDYRKKKMVVRSVMEAEDLRRKPTIAQALLDDIVPATRIEKIQADVNSQEMPDNDNQKITDGEIRIVTFFLPHYKEYDEDEKPYELHNALIVMAVNDSSKGRDDKPKRVILQILELGSRVYNPIVFSTLQTVMPGIIYDKGRLKQYLVYNTLLNLIGSSAGQAIQVAVDPPLICTDDTNISTEMLRVAPGVVWSAPRADSIKPMEYRPDINAFLAFAEFIVREAEEGMGMTKQMQGVDSGGASSRKTATQFERERQVGETRIDDIAEHQEFGLYKQFIFKYFLLTQLYIQAEVENALKALDKEAKKQNKAYSYEDKWDFVLDNAPLFYKFLISSNIEEKLNAKIGELSSSNMEETAKMTRRTVTLDDIYKAIIEPFKITDIKIEGSVNQMTLREERQDFLDYTGWLFDPNIQSLLKLRQKGVDIDILVERGKKLFNMSDDFVKSFQDLLAKGQQLMDPNTGEPEGSGPPKEELPVTGEQAEETPEAASAVPEA